MFGCRAYLVPFYHYLIISTGIFFNLWYISTWLLGCFVLYKDRTKSARFGGELHGPGCITVERKTPWGSYICNSALHGTMQSQQRRSGVPEEGKDIYFLHPTSQIAGQVSAQKKKIKRKHVLSLSNIFLITI